MGAGQFWKDVSQNINEMMGGGGGVKKKKKEREKSKLARQ